ncbi:hypothetical protein [Hymenobacter volaticus]|uniref:Uncharacterized protein n=1 Tax=Hymenobacter volaticus TaxID=2932254 RepID=A0ABY4G7C4_9BACT|nr:hypothetical protein [Hymenobacter volaticus]UOQ66786.1 hypothetical protein MUN86_02370 [Hymenobacter volaticus]
MMAFQLLKLVDEWAGETPTTPRSARSLQQLQVLREDVHSIALLVEQLLSLVPDSAQEAAQQQAGFWLIVENYLVELLQRGVKLDGVILCLHQEGIHKRDFSKYGLLGFEVPLDDLL